MRDQLILIVFLFTFIFASLLIPSLMFPGNLLHVLLGSELSNHAMYLSAIFNGIFYSIIFWLITKHTKTIDIQRKLVGKKILKEALIVLALILNLAFAYSLPILWKEEGIIYFLTLTAISFLGGLILLDPKKTFVYMCISYVLGAIVAVLIFALPAILFGQVWKLEMAISVTLPILTRGIIINLALCIFAAMVGCLVGQSIIKE